MLCTQPKRTLGFSISEGISGDRDYRVNFFCFCGTNHGRKSLSPKLILIVPKLEAISQSIKFCVLFCFNISIDLREREEHRLVASLYQESNWQPLGAQDEAPPTKPRRPELP